MKLTPPKKSTFWIAVVMAVVGAIAALLHYAKLLSFTWLGPVAFVLLIIAFVLLVIGLLVKGF